MSSLDITETKFTRRACYQHLLTICPDYAYRIDCGGGANVAVVFRTHANIVNEVPRLT